MVYDFNKDGFAITVATCNNLWVEIDYTKGDFSMPLGPSVNTQTTEVDPKFTKEEVTDLLSKNADTLYGYSSADYNAKDATLTFKLLQDKNK
jgi:hypothetical protein